MRKKRPPACSRCGKQKVDNMCPFACEAFAKPSWRAKRAGKAPRAPRPAELRAREAR